MNTSEDGPVIYKGHHHQRSLCFNKEGSLVIGSSEKIVAQSLAKGQIGKISLTCTCVMLCFVFAHLECKDSEGLGCGKGREELPLA